MTSIAGPSQETLETIPPDRFGKDHWSLLAYPEALSVDSLASVTVPSGTAAVAAIDRDRMRCNPLLHPHLLGRRQVVGQPVDEHGYRHSTRLRSPEPPVSGHDDWHVLDDLEAAGLVEILSLVNGTVVLTPAGLERASTLRRHRARGRSLAAFTPDASA